MNNKTDQLDDEEEKRVPKTLTEKFYRYVIDKVMENTKSLFIANGFTGNLSIHGKLKKVGLFDQLLLYRSNSHF